MSAELGPRASLDASAGELAAVDRAIAALEAQRGILGDEVVQTALAPLRERREQLLASELGEQRKLVTVLFADLVDFTVLSRRLDPEDTRAVVAACFAQWNAAVLAEGGVVEKFIGDAAMAVFGLHQSFEDDAERAVRAGLAMTAAMPALSAEVERRHGLGLHMRVGIDTGEVVVSTLGERPGHDFVAVGPTVNRASRLQSVAPVDGVLVSDETYRLVRSGFSVDPRLSSVLKGIDSPVDAYVVVSERPRGFRVDRVGAVGGVEAETVGRGGELTFLQDRLHDVVEESAWRLVCVVGEAGIGKSRLLRDLDLWLGGRPEPVWWFRGRASPSGRSRPNALTRDVIATRMDIQESDSPDVVRAKLEAGLATALGPGDEGGRAAHVLGAWLGFDLGPGGADGVPTDPQAVRDQGTQALGRYLARLAESAPVVLLLEDLHWADSSSIWLLDAAHQMLRGSPVLVVATMRPTIFEERPRWGGGLDHQVRLEMGPLSGRESRTLVRSLLHRVADLPTSVVDLVVDAAEGNPFYVEELVTWLVDSGVVVPGPDQWRVVPELALTLVVPATLKGLLQARLDALTPPERAVVQRASVVGRVFWDDAVTHLDPLPLEAATFDRLRERELVFERELSAFESSREFLFKHALLRDVAYDSLLRARRQEYHRRAARWVADVSARSGRGDEYAALVAEHLDRASDPTAATWYLRAARRATRVFALDEATQLLDRAEQVAPADATDVLFDIVATREDVFERVGDRGRQDADLEKMALLVVGLDDPRRQAVQFLARSRRAFDSSAYEDAISLAHQAIDVSTDAQVGMLVDLEAEGHLSLGKAYTWDGQNGPARASVTTALELSRATGQVALAAESLRYLGMIANNESEYAAALTFLQEARETFATTGDLEKESTALAQYGTTCFNMGRVAEARAAFEEVLEVFRVTGHKYRQTIVLGNLASIAMSEGDLRSARDWAGEAMEMSLELDDLESTSTNLVVVGIAEMWTGRWEQAQERFRSAIDYARRIPSTQHEVEASTWLAVGLLENLDAASAEPVATHTATLADDPSVSPLQRGQAVLVLGQCLISLGRGTDGQDAVLRARDVFAEADLDAGLLECDATLAAAAMAEGDPDTARTLSLAVARRLSVAELEPMVRPVTVVMACWQGLPESETAARALVSEAARAYLAPRLADAETSRGFRSLPGVERLLASIGPATAAPR